MEKADGSVFGIKPQLFGGSFSSAATGVATQIQL